MTDPHTTSGDSRGVPVIGLTGPVSAGKSSVARLLAAEGAHVIDVDLLGHVVLARPDVIEEVIDLLGVDVRNADGHLDHGRIAGKVFGDPAALRRLEEIVHPRVRADLDVAMAHAFAAAPRAVVIDAALLFEGGLDALCDMTVCVDADVASRIERAERARGWDADEVRLRDARQLSAAEKRARATRVLVNDGPIETLLGATSALLDEIAPVSEPADGGRTEEK